MQFKFSLRALLGLTCLIALVLAWYASSRQYAEQIQRLNLRLTYAEEELDRAKDDFEREQRRGSAKTAARRPFRDVKFDGQKLGEFSVVTGNSAFQNTSFVGCDLKNAKLTGETSSFQGARFDRANLAGAKLTGGGAAFQGASFASADLSGAILTGGGSAFQTATFEGANLTGTKIQVNDMTAFQSVNIDSAMFQNADLSAVDADALASCYFRSPPTYNGETRFPDGFDPAKQGWTRAP
jgi:uncharacterized protein YjbI with pentapeptide repeats